MAVIPATDIKTMDVRNTLGATDNNLSNLCVHVNINPYSKYKPVAYPGITKATNWWKAVYQGLEASDSGDCGLRIPDRVQTTSAAGRMAAMQDACSNLWEYRRPAGGVNEPYRLGDFGNYYHQAMPPILAELPASGEITINVLAQDTLQVNITIDPDDSTFNLQGYDLEGGQIDLKKYKFYGMIVYNGTMVKVEESDFILDQFGEIMTTALTFTGLSTVSASTVQCQLYVVLRNTDFIAGWEFIPLPTPFGTQTFNQFPYNLLLDRDALGAGGGIADPTNDIFFIPDSVMDYTYVKSVTKVSYDYGIGDFYLRNAYGDLIIRMKISNTSASPVTHQYSAFRGYVYDPIPIDKIPDGVFAVDGNGGIGTSLSEVVVPANGNISVWLKFDGLMDRPSVPVDTPTNVEFDIKLNLGIIFNCSLNYMRGTSGWVPSNS